MAPIRPGQGSWPHRPCRIAEPNRLFQTVQKLLDIQQLPPMRSLGGEVHGKRSISNHNEPNPALHLSAFRLWWELSIKVRNICGEWERSIVDLKCVIKS